jgi:hypothetical protein
MLLHERHFEVCVATTRTASVLVFRAIMSPLFSLGLYTSFEGKATCPPPSPIYTPSVIESLVIHFLVMFNYLFYLIFFKITHIFIMIYFIIKESLKTTYNFIYLN